MLHDKLNDKLNELWQAVSDWENAEGNIVGWNNRDVKLMTEPVANAYEAVFQATNTNDFDEADWELVLAVDTMKKEFFKWFDLWKNEATRHSARPDGSASLWSAYNNVYAIRDAAPPPQLETPAMLERQGLSLNQMAKAYGWKLQNGAPDVAKVQEELAEPGTHYKSPMYDPSVAVKQQHIAAQWTERAALLEAQQADEAAAKAPAPESLDQLIFERVSVKQIMKMKPELTRDEILSQADKLGVALDDRASVYAPSLAELEDQKQREAQERLQSEQRQAAVDSHPELEDRDERIRALAEQGLRPKDIVGVLEREYPDLSHQMVGRVINKTASGV